jgi:DNA-binding CsgD family transcriptional regulator/PAS domain-containing protein
MNRVARTLADVGCFSQQSEIKDILDFQASSLGDRIVNENSHGDFVDLLYDAALEPGLWAPVMERFADMIGGTSAWLSQLNMVDGTGGGMISRLDPTMPAIYAEHYALKNPLSNVPDADEYLRSWVPKILTDEDWMPKSDLVRTEYYNDFLAPQDVHSTLMIRLAAVGYDVSALNVNRPKATGQFDGRDLETAQRLHPHLIRAYSLTRKISALRRLNEDLIATLDSSPHGVILLDGSGRIRHINRAAERLVAAGDGLCTAGGRLGALTSDASKRLGALIASATPAGRTSARGGSMALPSPTRRLPLSVTVAPAGSRRFEIFDHGPSVVVCVTDLEAGVSLPEQKLRELFGLTPAETRVMLALFEGYTPQEAAEALGSSFHTVRVHLSRIFEKTGVHRQADLVRLMMRTVGLNLN